MSPQSVANRAIIASVAPSRIARLITIAGAMVLVCLTLVFAGGLAFGFAANTSAFIIHLLEFVWAVGIPLLGAGVLGGFGYKLLLEPIRRQRKLERIREYRARRALSRLDENGTN